MLNKKLCFENQLWTILKIMEAYRMVSLVFWHSWFNVVWKFMFLRSSFHCAFITSAATAPYLRWAQFCTYEKIDHLKVVSLWSEVLGKIYSTNRLFLNARDFERKWLLAIVAFMYYQISIVRSALKVPISPFLTCSSQIWVFGASQRSQNGSAIFLSMFLVISLSPDIDVGRR